MPFLKKSKMHLTDNDPCVGGKECVCYNTFYNECFHLKYFSKLLIPLSGLCVCVCFLCNYYSHFVVSLLFKLAD